MGNIGSLAAFIVVVITIASLRVSAQESLRADLPASPNGTNTLKTDIPWQPPSTEKLSEIYDYSIRSNSSIGSGNAASLSTLGRTVSSTNQSHLLGLRYGISERWALRFVSAAVDNHYIMQKNGQQRAVYVEGIGDCKLQGIFTIYKDILHRFEAYGGSTVPTGSTDLTGPDGQPLNPRNQLGSGTFDFVPGISYTFTKSYWSLGNKLEGVIHNGKNQNGYTLGDEYSNATTISYEIIKIFSPEFNFTVRDKQKMYNDHPMLMGAVGKVGVAGTGQAGPSSTQPDFNRAGVSFDGTIALVSHLPLSANFPIKASILVGTPVFRGGSKPDTGMQTNWFAGTTLTSTF